MNVIIRDVKKEDIPQVASIKINGWKTAYRGIVDDSFLDSFNLDKVIEKYYTNYTQNKFVVAEYNGEVVGFCRYSYMVFSPDGEGFDCELTALYVKPELKGNGIGKTIINNDKKDMLNNGKTKMILWCLKDNFPSRKFYEKMGGQVVGEHSINFGGKDYMEVGFGYKLI